MRYSKPKLFLLPAMFVMLAASQIAAAQSSLPLSGLYACEALSSKDAQLSCFIAETAKLRAAEGTGDLVAVEKESLAELEAAKLAAAEKERAADMKLAELKEAEATLAKKELAVETKINPPKEQTLAVRSTSRFGASKFYRFTLENGEVWQQAEAAYVRVGKGNPDQLVMKRRAMGSYTARVNGKAPSFRIKKIK